MTVLHLGLSHGSRRPSIHLCLGLLLPHPRHQLAHHHNPTSDNITRHHLIDHGTTETRNYHPSALPFDHPGSWFLCSIFPVSTAIKEFMGIVLFHPEVLAERHFARFPSPSATFDLPVRLSS